MVEAMAVAPRKKQRFRWTLKTMLVGMVLVAIPMSLVSHRQRLVSRGERAGWQFRYAYEYDAKGRRNITFDKATNSVVMPTPEGPEFLRKHLGVAYFNEIRGVHVSLKTDDDRRLFRQLASQPSITFLRIDHGHFAESDMRTIEQLPNLQSLHIDEARLTADQIRSLKASRPGLDLYIRRMEQPAD